MPDIQATEQGEQNQQGRYDLDIVLVEDHVLVRKDFRGNRQAFLREWYNLVCLQGIANVPAVYSVDEHRCILHKNLVFGRTLRDLLVEKGAAILLSQTQDDAVLQSLSLAERIEAVWARGREYLDQVVSASFFGQLEKQIDIIHSRGVVKLSLTFGNVMLGTADGKPWLIDFENSEYYRWKIHPLYWLRRRQDIGKFRRIYGLSTYEKSTQ